MIRNRTALIVSILLFLTACVSAGTFYVDQLGSGDFTSIQAAIDDILTGNGDVIIVSEGTYTENIDMKGFAITLRSTDPNDPDVVAATIIDGGAADTVITCTSGETVDTVISGFTIQNGQASEYGGGIYCYGSSPVIMKCIIIDNTTASGFGGGVFCYNGGTPTFSNCKILGNSSAYGGGVACYKSNPTIVSCVFSGNTGISHGGGVYFYQCSPAINSCSFSQNTANFGGSIYSYQSNVSVKNSILWGNLGTTGKEVYASGSNVSLHYCTVEGGWAGAGSNNMMIDPSFIDPDGDDDMIGTADDDLSLHPFSLCINAGDATDDYEDQTDIDNQKRVAYGRIDMGAYETYPIGGDLFVDEIVDVQDLMMFLEGNWMDEINLEDFAMLAEQWLYGAAEE